MSEGVRKASATGVPPRRIRVMRPVGTQRTMGANSGGFMSRYLIRVNGHLSDELSASLRGLDAQHQPAQTILVGDLADQAALTGILDRLDLLGVQIHEVLLVPDCPPVGVGAVLQAVPENGDTGRSATGAPSPDSDEAPNVGHGDDDSPAGG